MALVCSISNEVAEQPVISQASGFIFEKRLILKYINENGTDPMNGQVLTPEMLIEVKSNTPLIKPRPPTATSIPALLKALQDEWDAVMLNSFTLRQQLQTARQELSHALYQHDAACRVIARLTKEVTAAREALATLKPQSGVATVPQTMYAVESIGDQQKLPNEEGMNDEVIQKLQDKASLLTQLRKQKGKKVPEDLATVDDIKDYKCKSSQVGLHSASVPGILTLDIQSTNSNKVVTGGSDKTAVVFNNQSEQVVATLKGHTKKVTQAIYHSEEDVVITGSPDCTIRVWLVPKAQQIQFLKIHEAAITGLSLHPIGDYLLSCSMDDNWAFSDIRTGRLLIKVPASDKSSSAPGLTCAKFHPDGLIFGTGTVDSVIKIWDLKERTNVANFPGHSGPITSLAFSENGYYLATSAEDSVIKLWDLRKLKNFKTIELGENYEVKDLSFDYSGTYLACAGTDVRIYQAKQWDVLQTFTDHTAVATGVRFGHNAKTIVTASMDRSLKFYGI